MGSLRVRGSDLPLILPVASVEDESLSVLLVYKNPLRSYCGSQGLVDEPWIPDTATGTLQQQSRSDSQVMLCVSCGGDCSKLLHSVDRIKLDLLKDETTIPHPSFACGAAWEGLCPFGQCWAGRARDSPACLSPPKQPRVLCL